MVCMKYHAISYTYHAGGTILDPVTIDDRELIMMATTQFIL